MAEIHLRAVRLRESGVPWRQIANQLGVHYGTVMHWVRMKQKRGIEWLEALPVSDLMGKPNGCRASDAEYNERWLTRVRARCTTDANGCWLYHGFITSYGYGQDTYRSKGCFVHRKMFELVHGVELTPNDCVCHSCDVRNCCNPEHLWKGTKLDNNFDSVKKGRHKNLIKTHCPHGHEYTPENISPRIEKTGRPGRACRECCRINSRARWYQKKGMSREDAMKLARSLPRTRPPKPRHV